MALTKEFEYDCEVRGVHKNVQVRKATIVKDDGAEISRTTTDMYCIVEPKIVIHGAIQTSVVRRQVYKQCAMQCGLAQLRLPMKLQWMHRRYNHGCNLHMVSPND